MKNGKLTLTNSYKGAVFLDLHAVLELSLMEIIVGKCSNKKFENTMLNFM